MGKDIPWQNQKKQHLKPLRWTILWKNSKKTTGTNFFLRTRLIRRYKMLKEKEGIEDSDLVSNEPDHRADLIESTASETSYGSLQDKSIVLVVSQDLAIEVSPCWLRLWGWTIESQGFCDIVIRILFGTVIRILFGTPIDPIAHPSRIWPSEVVMPPKEIKFQTKKMKIGKKIKSLYEGSSTH